MSDRPLFTSTIYPLYKLEMTVTIHEAAKKLNRSTRLKYVKKPTIHKGERGHLIEKELGVPQSSNLLDFLDGELKTFTKGQPIAVTKLKHCLPEIFSDSAVFKDSKVYKKLEQVLFVAFSEDGYFLKSSIINRKNNPNFYKDLAEDYLYIREIILKTYRNSETLHTTRGPNGLLQISTAATKSKSSGEYTPLIFRGKILKDKGMGFFLSRNFGREFSI